LIERGNNYLVDVIHLDASQEETCEASQKWSSSSDGEFLVRHSTLSFSERIELRVRSLVRVYCSIQLMLNAEFTIDLLIDPSTRDVNDVGHVVAAVASSSGKDQAEAFKTKVEAS
ncbi:hypothetical protein D6D10_09320, partial [Aureobasidium pullulans]